MNKNLLDLIESLRSDQRLKSYDEAATKQGVVLRILGSLGWDSFNIDEVYPEFSVGVKKVDFALRSNNVNKVFIEVKKVAADLEKYQEQLLSYAFQEGVKIGVLTNGITWWFYLPLNEGSWEQRKFYTIELYDQNSKEVTQKLVDFLAKEKVLSGDAVSNAEKIYSSRQKQNQIKDTIPKAWIKLVSEPDELLVELIAEMTERLCGYKPDNPTIEAFLISHYEKVERRLAAQGFSGQEKKSKVSLTAAQVTRRYDYTGKSIQSFSFLRRSYKVDNWKGLLMQISELLYQSHKVDFPKVLNLVGRKRPYFTRDPNQLRDPARLGDMDIYVETNLSANAISRLSHNLIALLGYKDDDLSIVIH